jgi:hypothetical protein
MARPQCIFSWEFFGSVNFWRRSITIDQSSANHSYPIVLTSYYYCVKLKMKTQYFRVLLYFTEIEGSIETQF